jgi:hypothetical protein
MRLGGATVVDERPLNHKDTKITKEWSDYQGPLSLELFDTSYWAQDPAHVVWTGWEKSRPFFA